MPRTDTPQQYTLSLTYQHSCLFVQRQQNLSYSYWSNVTSAHETNVCWLVGCLKPLQHASVSQGRICSHSYTSYHTGIEVADHTIHLIQSQHADTGPTSPSADPITSGAWQTRDKYHVQRASPTRNTLNCNCPRHKTCALHPSRRQYSPFI